METTSMSVKGQVVIPNKIRKALGLKPNSKLIITVYTTTKPRPKLSKAYKKGIFMISTYYANLIF